MKTLESAEICGTGQPVSPDVAATAEVLRSLYLPHECRHLVELLQPSPSPLHEWRGAGDEADEMFLDLVEARLAGAATPMVQIHRVRDLRDLLQVQVRFLDALQDRLRQSPAHAPAGPRAGAESEASTPRRPAREELADLLQCERARYAPDGTPEVSRAIWEQLREEALVSFERGQR